MAAHGNFLNELRTGLRKFPNQEKCGSHRIELKQLEKLRSDCRIRPIVKCESDFPKRGCAPNRRAEQFRRRRHHAPGGNSQSGCRAARHNRWQEIQFVSKSLFSHDLARHARRWVTLKQEVPSKSARDELCLKLVLLRTVNIGTGGAAKRYLLGARRGVKVVG
jgi:hypothetical protein